VTRFGDATNQIAEVDQLDAKLRDDIEADSAEIERRRAQTHRK